MIFQINFQVKEKKSKVKGYSVSATDLIEVIGLSKISSINGSFPSVYFSSLWSKLITSFVALGFEQLAVVKSDYWISAEFCCDCPGGATENNL